MIPIWVDPIVVDSRGGQPVFLLVFLKATPKGQNIYDVWSIF